MEQQYFHSLREVGEIFGVSHLTLQARGIQRDPTNPARGTLTIGPGTPGAISMSCLRIGGQWAVTNKVLAGILQDMGAMSAKDVNADMADGVLNDIPASGNVKRGPGRPRKSTTSILAG